MLDRKMLRLAAAMTLSLLASGCNAAEPDHVWQEKCARCHGQMTQFAKRSLCLSEAMPALRDGGEKLDAFLAHHGRLSSSEIEAVCQGIAEQLEKPFAK